MSSPTHAPEARRRREVWPAASGAVAKAPQFGLELPLRAGRNTGKDQVLIGREPDFHGVSSYDLAHHRLEAAVRFGIGDAPVLDKGAEIVKFRIRVIEPAVMEKAVADIVGGGRIVQCDTAASLHLLAKPGDSLGPDGRI